MGLRPKQREWGKVKAVDVMAALTGEWQGIATIAKILGATSAVVAYRCRMMAADGLIEADQVAFKGGPMVMNVYRLKQPVPQAAVP